MKSLKDEIERKIYLSKAEDNYHYENELQEGFYNASIEIKEDIKKAVLELMKRHKKDENYYTSCAKRKIRDLGGDGTCEFCNNINEIFGNFER